MDRDVLVADIDHEQRVGQRFHRLDAAEAALELFHFAAQLRRFLLAALVEQAALAHFVEIGEPLDGLADRLEVGQHAAEPALVDERHRAAQGFRLHGIARGALGADEQHGAAVGDHALHEVRRLLVEGLRLLEVDDVDAIALTEDERGHLRVPEAGLVSEMDARFQHLSHGHAGHKNSCRVEPPRRPPGHPRMAEARGNTQPEGHLLRVWIALPKKAALYTMCSSRKQRLTPPPPR
ncbi:MAG: hypothetical protein CMLOHMNK_01324 [Steroidobacteraceae bacterium]|nr:hypothetical protein [Steroidobacteraceae bacterium]